MQQKKWVACVAAIALWAAAAHAQPVYKWVDAEGKTHYGAQPPPDKADANPLKLQSNNGTSGSGGATKSAGKGASTQNQTNPDGTKKISKDVQEFGEGMNKALGTVDGKQVPLDCGRAVGNIHGQADSMLEVGQKNVRDGYMTQADFDKTAPQIRQSKSQYSVGDCQSSAGNKKMFYQCMTSSQNHILGCSQKFKH